MIAVVSRARGGRPPMMVPSARRELGGGARQPSGFNNSGEGGRVAHDGCGRARARGAAADDGAVGAARARGWRATAIRFQQFGEGGELTMIAVVSRARGVGRATIGA